MRSFLCLCSNVRWYRKKGNRIQDRIKSDLIASKWLFLNIEVISYVYNNTKEISYGRENKYKQIKLYFLGNFTDAVLGRKQTKRYYGMPTAS